MCAKILEELTVKFHSHDDNERTKHSAVLASEKLELTISVDKNST